MEQIELNHYVMVDSLRLSGLPLAPWDSTVTLLRDDKEWVAFWTLRWDPDGDIAHEEEIPSPSALHELVLSIFDRSFGMSIRSLELEVEIQTRAFDTQTMSSFKKDGFGKFAFYELFVVADESSIEMLRTLGFLRVDRVTCSIQRVSPVDPSLGIRKWNEAVLVTEEYETYRNYSEISSTDPYARRLQQPEAFISRLIENYIELY